MAIELDIISIQNESKQKLVIDETLNSLECNHSLLYKHIRVIQSNSKRVRSSHYKNISGLRGSTRKIRPQKRMGKSRQGASREIHMRGGSVKFGFSGDKDRDMHRRFRAFLNINKKEKITSQKMVFANKLQNKLITVIRDAGSLVKTKDFSAFFKKSFGERCSYIFSSSASCQKASRNVKDLYMYNIESVNIVNLLSKPKVIFDLEAIEVMLKKLNIEYKIKN